jgi:cephalosporin hydroxylase
MSESFSKITYDENWYNAMMAVGEHFITGFHKLFYSSGAWGTIKWCGSGLLKNPFDIIIYQEIIFDVKPDLIIELGTGMGGSALFMAQILDYLGNGKVISVDAFTEEEILKDTSLYKFKRPKHKRITYWKGKSCSPDIEKRIKKAAKSAKTILLVLDSDHSMNNVLAEMWMYHSLVSKGSYMIVDDTNLNGYPVLPGYGPGPMEAVKAFFDENDLFVIDKAKERLLLTQNPNGYLQRIK